MLLIFVLMYGVQRHAASLKGDLPLTYEELA
jgi:hypothetical protein